MKKHITTLTHWFARRLNRLAASLENTGLSAVAQSKFVDLAPTDEADKAGIYAEAILFATNNAKVTNIALTGPYGSGKSSIIQSFLKRYRRPALHISLAAFVPEADTDGGKVSRQEIERSILQQMLYGADANKLPLSRFKRIQSPGIWSIFKSLYLMLGILALWYVFHQREDIINGTFFAPLARSNWFNLGSFAFAIIFLWMALHHFYVASFGVSIKSISLKDVDIRPASDDQGSILNRHLDEIVYFFQSTAYDLVIIEDLDRFNNADIFVTLREINTLVNENAGVKRTIRFLYALRDDMFVNTDRTKFFEFIIPVIPIINTSNSIDKVLEQGKRLELDERLDRQFLREVSRYLNDLRLIQNIFNEYAIYVANLETDGANLLDANKLLAILIYKNVYPRDFEQLHRGLGNLAKILNLQDELIKHGEATHRSEIAALEQELEVAERQTPSDLKELRQIYAMALIEKFPVNTASISVNAQNWIALQQLAAQDSLEQLLPSQNLILRTVHGQNQSLNIANLQNEVDSQRSYQQRKAEIESKAADSKNVSLRQIRDLRSNIATLRTTKLHELLRLNAARVRDLFKDFGDNGELARFLILEGYLDDTYYQYTSLFHSGRLSPNDNKFLIQIRAYITPEPGFPIDNPKEVVAAMRDEDFRQRYVLNVKLVDCLLSDPSHYVEQTQKLFQLVATEFERCESFFDAYYAGGRHVAGLLSGLADTWNGLVPTVIVSPKSISHITHLVAAFPENSLKSLSNNFNELSNFVADNLPQILANAPELAPERLKWLGLEIKDLTAIKEHPGIARFMFEEGHFQLTIANLEYVHQVILGENNIEPMRTRNYTTVRSTSNVILLKRINLNFDIYLRDVLLELQANSREDIPAILDIVCRDMLDQDDIRKFLERQTTVLPTLEEVPDRLHATFFQLNAIKPTWSNCFAFIKSKEFEVESLIAYLDRDDVRATILEHAIPGDPDSLPLRSFLIEAGSLSDAAYEQYAQSLPKPFKKFPESLEPTKLRILIDKAKITFTKESFDALSDYKELQVLFVAANVESYLAGPNNFALDDAFREDLLRTGIDHRNKRAIVQLMDLSTLPGLPERSALIGPIINHSDANITNIDASIAQTLIAYSRPLATQIALFNKFQSLMTDDDARRVLANLPKPFSEIGTGYNTPRLTNSAENLGLVRWLDSRNIISSWSQGGLFTDDIKVNLYRR